MYDCIMIVYSLLLPHYSRAVIRVLVTVLLQEHFRGIPHIR